jgi:hypothetical protein
MGSSLKRSFGMVVHEAKHVLELSQKYAGTIILMLKEIKGRGRSLFHRKEIHSPDKHPCPVA